MLKKEEKAKQIILTETELEALLIRASKQGSKAALHEIGLNDDHAHIDIRDLRELMRAFRMAKKDSFRVFVKLLASGYKLRDS